MSSNLAAVVMGCRGRAATGPDIRWSGAHDMAESEPDSKVGPRDKLGEVVLHTVSGRSDCCDPSAVGWMNEAC